MPEIDLGLGVVAELDGDEVRLTDKLPVSDPDAAIITLSLDQFDRLAAFVAQHRSKP